MMCPRLRVSNEVVIIVIFNHDGCLWSPRNMVLTLIEESEEDRRTGPGSAHSCALSSNACDVTDEGLIDFQFNQHTSLTAFVNYYCTASQLEPQPGRPCAGCDRHRQHLEVT